MIMYFKKTKILVLFVLFYCEQFKYNSAESPYDQEKEIGESVTLKCSLTDLYNSEVSWSKIDGEIDSSSQQKDGELLIPSVKASDAGEYECSYGADYFEGESQTDKVKLTVRGEETETVQQEAQSITEEITKEVGQEATEPVTQEITQQVTEQLTQEITQPVSEQVTQEITQTATEQVTQEITQTATEQVTQEITQPEIEDEQPEQSEQTQQPEYTEQPDQPEQSERPVFPNYGNDPMDETTKPNIDFDEDDGYFRILTTVDRQNFLVNEGDEVEIICTSLTNAYTMDIIWLNPKREQIVSDSRYIISPLRKFKNKPLTKQSTLTIRNIRVEDSGLFECRGTTGLLNDESKFKIRVNKAETPTIQTSVNRPEVNLNEGDTAEITCTAFSNTDYIDIIWISPLREQIIPSNKYQITTRIVKNNPLTKESVLRLIGVQDNGQYECIGTTKLTEDVATFNINIRHKIIVDIDCNCHNHSLCTCSGYCYNCTHNTIGDRCQYCDESNGYFGDATRGTPWDCQPRAQIIQTTTTTTTTTTRRTLPPIVTQIIDDNGCNCFGHSTECTCSGLCHRWCQHNTEGDHCERCKPGFSGDAKKGTPYDCQPDIRLLKYEKKHSKSSKCNQYGTANNSESSCKCKTGVTGQSCDQCKPRYFNLAANNKKGCLSCFCNGLSVECKSSDLYYRKEISDFANEDWYLSNKYTQLKEDVQLVQNGVQYNRINQHQNEDLYFIVSSKFKGNHLLSYDGDLSFKFKFELPESSNENIEQLEIRISGSSINIVHVVSHNLLPNIENEINVKLNENSFMRYGDNNKIEREFLLMALADIDLIMIKAKLSNEQSSASISNFSIETADGKDTNQRLAFAVEVCTCPPGYTGTSCELCTSGFKRSGQGFYWGFCEPI